MRLTNEDVRLLADLERKMDRGEQPYVVLMGDRMAVDPQIMEELGLENKQTVSSAIVVRIMGAQISLTQAKIEMEKLSD